MIFLFVRLLVHFNEKFSFDAGNSKTDYCNFMRHIIGLDFLREKEKNRIKRYNPNPHLSPYQLPLDFFNDDIFSIFSIFL